ANKVSKFITLSGRSSGAVASYIMRLNLVRTPSKHKFRFASNAYLLRDEMFTDHQLNLPISLFKVSKKAIC
ncbi:hypothetical protein, partial [Megasphaera massiliensis]|uniref:hypothetical protein n=1 Tax=Megasphaera massiliensis TaxID=1232428 RepID=UPI001E3C6807